MSLTAEERQIVIDRLKVYPVGVSANAWGYGPLSNLDDDDDDDELTPWPSPDDFEPESLQEYG